MVGYHLTKALLYQLSYIGTHTTLLPIFPVSLPVFICKYLKLLINISLCWQVKAFMKRLLYPAELQRHSYHSTYFFKSTQKIF